MEYKTVRYQDQINKVQLKEEIPFKHLNTGIGDTDLHAMKTEYFLFPHAATKDETEEPVVNKSIDNTCTCIKLEHNIKKEELEVCDSSCSCHCQSQTSVENCGIKLPDYPDASKLVDNNNIDITNPFNANVSLVGQQTISSRDTGLQRHTMEETMACSKTNFECQTASCSFKNHSAVGINGIKTQGKRHPHTLSTRCYTCVTCSREFSQKSGLKYHIMGVHLKIKCFTCTQCHKQFLHKGHLKHHVKSVHEKLKACTCNECGYKFSSMSNLNRHNKAVHLKIKDFRCTECDKYFSNKCKLNDHKKYVHEKLKNFTCNECGKQFVRVQQLNRHHKNVHGILLNVHGILLSEAWLTKPKF